jgi:hypothetical protein
MPGLSVQAWGATHCHINQQAWLLSVSLPKKDNGQT